MASVRQSRIGFGSLGVGGDLGFEATMTGGRVMLPPRIAFDEALSAHAPSELVVDIAEPTLVRGALNGSTRLQDGVACEFWIDDHWLGDLASPCAATPAIDLPPGTYRLAAATTGTNWGAHSLWLFSASRAEYPRIALITVACYPRDRLKDNLRWLYASAAKAAWLVHPLGVGTVFENFYSAKIERFVDWLKALPRCYQHVVFLDARDTFVLGTEREAAGRLEHSLLIGMESGSWPEQGAEWAGEFRTLVAQYEEFTSLCFINAGMYAGRRDAVTRFLESLIRLRAQWQSGDGPDWLRPYRHFNDDQFLFHARYRLDPSSIRLDTRAELLCNMSWQHVDLAHPDVTPGDRRMKTRYGTEPLFFHFSGPQTCYLPHWYHWLLD